MRKFEKEERYALRKDLWCFSDNRIAVRFQYEYFNSAEGKWHRAYGNENWEFDERGFMRRREASINDVDIDESERRITGPREPGDDDGIPLR
jgi:nuclear transport factor 2 (NTF2) superfamily protein